LFPHALVSLLRVGCTNKECLWKFDVGKKCGAIYLINSSSFNFQFKHVYPAIYEQRFSTNKALPLLKKIREFLPKISNEVRWSLLPVCNYV
jgi:hypothetical protein